MSQSGLIINGQVYCLCCTRATLISMEEGTSFVWGNAPHLYGGMHLICMGEGTSFVWRKAGKAGEGSKKD